MVERLAREEATMSAREGPLKRRSSRDALKWSYILAWVTKGINIVSLFVLAKLLGPEAFGVAALAMTFVMLIEVIVDSGLMMAIVQRKDLDPRDLDSLFWLNIAISVVLALLGYLGSDLLGWVVDNKEVPLMFAALSPLILVKGLTVVQMGLAQRNMMFKTLAIRGATGAAIGGIAAVIAALAGLGIWSLIVQYLTTALISLVMLWRLGDWRPTMRFEWKRATSFFHFSSGIVSSQIAVFAANHADVFVMGALFGEAAVGIFRLALRVVNLAVDMLVRPVQVVATPRLAGLQHDPAALRAETLRLLRKSTLLMLPAMAALAASAELCSVLLGSRWQSAESAIRILTILGVVKSATLLSGPVLLALGRSHTAAIGSWTSCFVTVAIVLLVGMLTRNQDPTAQVDAIAWARAAALTLFVAPVQCFFMGRMIQLTIPSLALAIAPGVIAAIATLTVGMTLQASTQALGASEPISASCAAFSSMLTAAAIVVLLRRRSRQDQTSTRAAWTVTSAIPLPTADPATGDRQ